MRQAAEYHETHYAKSIFYNRQMGHDELVAWLRERLDQKPLPRLREELIASGQPPDAVDAALKELFPGDPEARRRRVLRGGLIGAAAGVLAWTLAAWLYRR